MCSFSYVFMPLEVCSEFPFCPTYLHSATETSILMHFFACGEVIFTHILACPRVP